MALAYILYAKGFEILSAIPGAKALEIIRKQPIDILLMDGEMPEMNGLELCRETHKLCPKIITFITACAAEDLFSRAWRKGSKRC